jgi:hypothetical protein
MKITNLAIIWWVNEFNCSVDQHENGRSGIISCRILTISLTGSMFSSNDLSRKEYQPLPAS